nr:tRNA dimethylallyltransferase isoform X2 [Nomia melanderi]
MGNRCAHAQSRIRRNNYGNIDMSCVPVLAILGSTGCGKSRLSIELAKRFSGEIVSADSMQIDDLLARQKLPIIVGGTNYYIEALLWKILVSGRNTDSSDNSCTEEVHDGNDEVDKMEKISIRDTDESTEELHKRLWKVDPEMAKRLHPNNRRKIIRSLEVFENHGVTLSEILRVQRTTSGSGLGGLLRYPNSILIWLQCKQTVLEERLSSRVDAMLETGLIQELLDFHQRYNQQRIESNTLPDYTKGIFQTIGFKEFHSYLILSEEEKQEKKGQELLQKGIDDLKLVTKRYARTQERWIRNRMIRRSDRQVPPIYILDCTDLNAWNSCVYEKAVAIVEASLRGEKPEQKPVNEFVIDVKNTDSSNEECRYCDICEKTLVGEQWDIHLKGMRHQRALKRKKKFAEQQKSKNMKQSEPEELKIDAENQS